MKEHYDIFISYRRDGGFETAKHLNDLLINDGYTVSFDIDTLREGDFDETLLKRIDQCVDFILVVDKHTFDRTLDPNFDPNKDWLRKELAYALKLRKNIIPILLYGVEGFPNNLPEDVASVVTKNGPEYNKSYFDEFYRRLKSFLHCVPRNLSINQRKGKNATVTFRSDFDVAVVIDGEISFEIKGGAFTKYQLAIGQHLIEYKSIAKPSRHYTTSLVCDESKHYVESITFADHGLRKYAMILLSLLLVGITICCIYHFCFNDKQPDAQEDSVAADVQIDYPKDVEIDFYESTLYVNGIPYKMIDIKGGSFIMGDDVEGSAKHKVTLSDYKIGQTEIPQSIWEAIIGNNPSLHKGPNYPVEQVSWNDCQLFIERLNQLSGQEFVLPTEAQWEYAAKGAEEETLDINAKAWYGGNSGHTTHAVGTKEATQNNLHDIFGNVWEWCNDIHAEYSKNDAVNPAGAKAGDMRVYRGGGCGSNSEDCNSTTRGALMPEEKADALGFRLAIKQ